MQRRMIERIWEDDEGGDKKVVIPPVDSGRPPHADRVASRLDAKEPARRKHHRATPYLAASTRRPPRPRSTRPSPPLVLRAAATTQRAGRGNERTAVPRRSRIERHAAHAVGPDRGGRASSRSKRRTGAAPSILQMRRLEAPADHKPHLDQHQRRASRSRNRETRS